MQNTGSACFTCLSKDRNTWPLEEYFHIYDKLFDKCNFAMVNQRQICWECRAVFRKIEQFVNKATYAQSILSQKNHKCLSTLNSVRHFKTIKINYEQTKLNPKTSSNSQSEFEEVPVKIDYDSVMFSLPLQTTTTDCDIANNDSFILDEQYIKIERNTQLTCKDSPNQDTSDDGGYPENNSKDNETDMLDIKNEQATYCSQVNNVVYVDDQLTKIESDDCNQDNTNDSEDEMIINKKTYKKILHKQRKRKGIKLEEKRNNKKYISNDSPVKFETTYKIVTITEQEEENWLKIERMDVAFSTSQIKCEKCVLHFASREKLKEHNVSHHKKITEFKCVYCDAYYHNKFTLQVHQASRHLKLYVCLVCGTEHHTKTSIYEHYDMKHNNRFQCKECCLYYGKSHLMHEHYNEMHTRLECDYCKKVFPNKQKIIKHIRANHQILCNLCNQQFVRRSALDYHYATRHKVKEDETTFCVECNKQFTCAMKYRYHIKYSNIHRIQNGQPALIARSVCPICKKDYYSKTIMENHLDYVHLKNYKYTCDICNKHVLNNDKLTKHKKRYHLGQKPPKNKICHICGRGFEVNKILRNHIRTHTGERPFECPHCPSRFSQTAARYLHIKNVHLKNATAFPTNT